MTDRPKRLAGPLALGLAGLLCLLFSAAVLLSSGSFFSDGAPVPEKEPEQEELLMGRNAPDQTALELLPGETVDLNSADALELQKLPGIGEGLSAAIVADREENGPFASVEDLLRVPGIGEKRLEAIRDLITAEPED